MDIFSIFHHKII